MGSFRSNCEIVEVNDEPSTTRRTFYPDQRPPMVKKGPNKFLEDDINKLFESVNLRSSKSLDLSDSWRNASKRPMRGSGSQSPGIGFSAPVSLKQSLRGLCISQAAEMAAMKRASLPASPRISEVGKFSNFYRSVVGEASGSGGSPSRGVEYKTKSCLMESTSCSSEISPPHHENTVMTSATQFSCSSPCLNVEPIIKNIKCISLIPEVDTVLVETVSLQKQESISDSAKPRKNASSKLSGSNKVANDLSEESAANSKVINQTAPKQRRKPAPSSSAKNSNKDVKSTRSTTRSVKPVIRNKNLVIKKPKKVVVSPGGNLEVSHEVNNRPSPGLAHSHVQLICQRCYCSLKETSNVSPNDLQAITSADVSKSNPINSTPHVVKTNMPSKSNEKGDISLSSKSSDFSSSTTSLSEESNLSGSNFGNRPHMSKDIRWMMIGRIRKQFGFLGLSHFNLINKLGSGDIGTVYLAELVGTNCPFAIKVMDNEFLAQRQKMARAQTEREILRMLDHPFLPTLYAQFTSDNLSCLVMEFCPGGDLHVLRQKQPCRYFPEQAARFYVAEVLLALEYLHMLGIVYRDLKPENILVREDGHIMLTDFDLSLRCSVNPMLVKSSSLQMDPPRMSGPCTGSNCIDPFCAGPSCQVSCFTPRLLPGTSRSRKAKVDATTRARSLPQLVAEPTEARSNSFVGTHEYLAPEIIKGEGHGSAVDWWTFGVFLYELLYGKTPFKGVGNEETLDNVVLQNLRFPDSPMVSFQARDLIRGLLIKEPEGRLGTETGAAEIKRHPFFEGLNWALIRCAVPPEIPEMYDADNSEVDSQEKGGKFMEYDGNGRHLEFELF